MQININMAGIHKFWNSYFKNYTCLIISFIVSPGPPDPRADAGTAAGHLGGRAQDRALRHPRHRRGRVHGQPRRRHERTPGPHQARPHGGAAAPAALLGQDHARLCGAEGGVDGERAGRGAAGAGGAVVGGHRSRHSSAPTRSPRG